MIILPAQLDRYNRKKDKSFSITFATQELTEQQILEVNSKVDQYGFLAFKDDAMLTSQEQKDLESMKAEYEGKSLSERFRNVLYVYWEQKQKEAYPKFEDFYKDRMENKIEEIKKTLD